VCDRPSGSKDNRPEKETRFDLDSDARGWWLPTPTTPETTGTAKKESRIVSYAVRSVRKDEEIRIDLRVTPFSRPRTGCSELKDYQNNCEEWLKTKMGDSFAFIGDGESGSAKPTARSRLIKFFSPPLKKEKKNNWF
jgi:hypothetical protein